MSLGFAHGTLSRRQPVSSKRSSPQQPIRKRVRPMALRRNRASRDTIETMRHSCTVAGAGRTR